jgi:hypothetical protein
MSKPTPVEIGNAITELADALYELDISFLSVGPTASHRKALIVNIHHKRLANSLIEEIGLPLSVKVQGDLCRINPLY